jgi:hypothetical protein
MTITTTHKTISLGQIFWPILTTRDIGKKAYKFMKNKLAHTDEEIIFNMSDVILTNPSFCDEFFVPLAQSFGDRFSVTGADTNWVRFILDFLSQKSKITIHFS